MTPEQARALADAAMSKYQRIGRNGSPRDYIVCCARIPKLTAAIRAMADENERLTKENQRTHEALSRMTQVATGDW